MKEQGNTSLSGGNLGRPSGARYKTWDRVKNFLSEHKGTIWDTAELNKAFEEIYNYPLKQSAIDKLNRHLKSGISDFTLVELITGLSQSDMLCNIKSVDQKDAARVICSMGLKGAK